MDTIKPEKIERIKKALHGAPLENLVAVFSHAADDALLLVYTSGAERARGAGFESISLEDLPRQSLDRYDGPILSFTALDLIRGDILAKGPGFYPLGKLFFERDCVSGLNRTRFNLAQFLWTIGSGAHTSNPEDWTRRMWSKTIELALPALIDNWPRENLVAIIPPGDLGEVLSGSATLVYAGATPAVDGPARCIPLEQLAQVLLGPEPWIVAFEDLEYFDARLHSRSPRFMELRYFLHAPPSLVDYQATLQCLARHCLAQADERRDWRALALSLASEYWLSRPDAYTDDLIAIVPDADVENYLSTGASRRYFRRLPESVSNVPDEPVINLPLDRLFHDLSVKTASTRYAQSYAVLRGWIDTNAGAQWGDLSSILWKAGHLHSIGRTGFVYARDLVKVGTGQRERHSIRLEQVADLAMRACVIHGLLNPWDWPQSRAQQHLEGAYQTLLQALDVLSTSGREPDDSCYQMLRAWFGSALAPPNEIERRVRAWVDAGNRFMDESREMGAGSVQTEWLEQARRLVLIGEAILDILGSGGYPGVLDRALRLEPEQRSLLIPKNLREATNPIWKLDTPSALFYKHLQNLKRVLEPLQIASQQQGRVDERIRIMEQATDELIEACHLIFAQPHEERVLQFLYKRVLDETRERIARLKTSALLQCDLLTDNVPIHRASPVTFRLTNIGPVAARNVEATLLASETFEVRGESPMRKIGDLDTNQPQELTFTIYARVDQDLILRLMLSGHDEEQTYSFGQKEARVTVVSLDQGPFQRKSNPYIYGAPIQHSQSFYGRSAELLTILDSLVGSGQQNFVLRGPRRTGKTSLLFMLKAAIENDREARLRFQIAPEWESRLDRMHPLSLNLQGIDLLGGRLDSTSFFAALLPRLGQAAGWKEAQTRELREQFDALRVYGLGQQVREVLNHFVEQLEPDHRVVILLDEFDLVSVLEDKAFLGFLRAIVQEYQRWITWILASAVGLYRDVQAYESPFFNLFKPINLGDLSFEEARRLVLTPVEYLNLQFLPEAVNAIYQITRGHPYFLQLLCSEIIQEVNREQTNYVTFELVEKVVQAIIRPGQAAEDHFHYLWDTATEMGQLVLALLNASREPLTRGELGAQVERAAALHGALAPGWVARQLDESCKWLAQVLEAIGTDNRERYLLRRPLFARWFAEKSKHANLLEEAQLAVLMLAQKEDAYA